MKITLSFPAGTPWQRISPVCESLATALEENFPNWPVAFQIEWEPPQIQTATPIQKGRTA